MNEDANIVSLNRIRAEKTGDCRHWTARDALQSLIDEIDNGSLKNPKMVAVIMTYDDDDGSQTHRYATRYAGGNMLELLGLIERSKSIFMSIISR